MKREIVCSTKECEPRWVKWKDERTGQTYESQAQPYPGEYVKVVRGTAKKDMVCDVCGKPILKGMTCSAVSMWADYGGIPYYPWEHEYLEKGDVS